jgi:hypothetical protein
MPVEAAIEHRTVGICVVVLCETMLDRDPEFFEHRCSIDDEFADVIVAPALDAANLNATVVAQESVPAGSYVISFKTNLVFRQSSAILDWLLQYTTGREYTEGDFSQAVRGQYLGSIGAVVAQDVVLEDVRTFKATTTITMRCVEVSTFRNPSNFVRDTLLVATQVGAVS